MENQDILFDSKGTNIILMFGDIRGFRIWTRRVGHASQSFKNLMHPSIKEWTSLKNKGYLVKVLGDGFMAVKDMKKGHNCKLALSFIEDALEMSQFMTHIIKNHNYPRPDGFRVRISSGEVAKFKSGKRVDYLGALVNITKDLLLVKPEVPCIAHESVKELLDGKKSSHIKFEKVVIPSTLISRGVEKEDLDALWQFERGKK